jgi:hypothetical protein
MTAVAAYPVAYPVGSVSCRRPDRPPGWWWACCRRFRERTLRLVRGVSCLFAKCNLHTCPVVPPSSSSAAAPEKKDHEQNHSPACPVGWSGSPQRSPVPSHLWARIGSKERMPR